MKKTNRFTDNPLIGQCLKCRHGQAFYSIDIRKWCVKCTCGLLGARTGKWPSASLLESDDQTPYLINETTLNEQCPIYAERVILAANSVR